MKGQCACRQAFIAFGVLLERGADDVLVFLRKTPSLSANGEMYPAPVTRSAKDGFAALQKHIRRVTDVFYYLANLSLALRRIFLMPQTHP